MSQRLAFSTGRFPKEQRQVAFTGHIRDELFSSEIQSLEDGFNAAVSGFRFDTLCALTFRVDGHAMQRTPELTQRSPKDSVFVSAVLDGEMTHFHPERTHVLRPGSILVYPGSEAYLLASRRGTRQLFMDIPMDVARSTFGLNSIESAQEVRFSELTDRRFNGSKIEELASAVEHRGVATGELGSDIVGLASAIIKASRPDDLATIRFQVVETIRLLANDSDTDSNTIAESLGYSVRHLNRLLASRQTTIAHELLTERLRRATALIEATSLSQTEIASRSGFGSVSTMQRHLRKNPHS